MLAFQEQRPKQENPLHGGSHFFEYPEDNEKAWIGINENAANRYVEHFLRNGGFSDIVGYPTSVQREVFLK